MDNDNKINYLLTNGSLPGGKLFSNTKRAETYDLEEEYAKTKKNKSFKNYIILASTIVAVILISFGITAYIDHKYSNIEVDIDVFEDLNLKNLLNMVGQLQSDLSNARDEKRHLELDMNAELNRIDLKLEAEKDLISKKRILSGEKEKQIASAESAAQAEKRKVKSDYGSKIANVKITIDDLESELAKYESSSLQVAQEKQSVLDSERQLFELEKKTLKNEYETTIQELRTKMALQQEQAVVEQKRAVELAIREYQQRIDELDPVISDSDIVLTPQVQAKTDNKNESADEGRSESSSESADASSDRSTSVAQSEKTMPEKDMIESANDYLQNINSISSYISSIPYENNLGDYSNKIQENTKNLELVFDQIEQINSIISYFDSLYEAKLTKLAVDGCIISSNEKSLVCYVLPIKRESITQTKILFPNKDSKTDEKIVVDLKKFGEFFIGTTENPNDLAKISKNSNFVLSE